MVGPLRAGSGSGDLQKKRKTIRSGLAVDYYQRQASKSRVFEPGGGVRPSRERQLKILAAGFPSRREFGQD